uniref:Uncharacterized protein n=1 Tax=Pyxicephalus adspersus TaxID=30357 RepID=A0AAV3AMT1_PYXAD|nr:TPA: hypothetical protein GDO54_008366 [Pyxicephalus adspersus]
MDGWMIHRYYKQQIIFRSTHSASKFMVLSSIIKIYQAIYIFHLIHLIGFDSKQMSACLAFVNLACSKTTGAAVKKGDKWHGLNSRCRNCSLV